MFHYDVLPVTIPTLEEDQLNCSTDVSPLWPRGSPRYRLLIAEDQPENRLPPHQLLEPLGFDLREAAKAMRLDCRGLPRLLESADAGHKQSRKE